MSSLAAARGGPRRGLVPVPALAIARREVKDTFTDWRVLVPMFTLALLFPAILVAGMNIGLPYMHQVDTTLAAEKAALFGATMAAFFPISFSLIIALESFAGEKERNTLEALLATPVSDGDMFLGKFLAVLVPPALLSLLGLLVFTSGIWLLLDLRVPLDFFFLALALSLVEATTMVAAAVIISSQTASVKAANLLASFIIIPVALVVQGEVMLLLLGYGSILWLVFLEFVLIAVTLVRMGMTLFNREEVLTRENDDLNLRALGQQVMQYWNRLPDAADGEQGSEKLSPLRLYRKDLPRLLRLYRGPLALAACSLIAGGIAGYLFALLHPLGLPLAQFPQFLDRKLAMELADAVPVPGLFLHNLQTLLLAGLLSLISLGVVSLVVTVLTAGAVGFLAGQAALAGLDLPMFLLAFIVPHGIFEVPAIILGGACNLWLGMCLMTLPKGRSLGDGLLMAFVNWGKGAALFVPLLLLAAIVEAKITPLVVFALYGGS